jgi:hypothetical protein
MGRAAQVSGISTEELRRRVAGPEGTVVRLRLVEGSAPAAAALGIGAGGSGGVEFDVELVRARRGFFPRVRGRACAAL